MQCICFRVPQKKNKCYDKPSKKQSERAKMAGVSCWECKKYYDNLGLCEEEIEARQNQCSRHRTATRNVRESTPEGFWDPLFPETYTSTYQD
ncbi:DNA endonuclease RBBP8 [Xylocopa sonorina]|uniref:DNA endonuclease RBBP8 n=1 Tax=Xylocopa sonorina TaxID=1818115 RepID=UPI00403B0D16